ncbi:response regulator transcription factor [Nocardioides panzhihuensis]|uniref:DNA-binding NarL/FixJ family response regulator n=1 Tax=Nocardioides panzhihuensis TaxID=860243 RepID=A0A7Z0ITJ1_9ACTN|nr:response regulator transcription factor [Nocardioides panzhihuensis]NYI78873.1 DNA-binding NarL/FixJ family response regulator [Nocardioides panzhihuensis]
MSTKVVIVDDEPLVRSGLQAILGAEPDLQIVGSVGDGSEAVAEVRRSRPDVVLMDVRMPRLDGIAATKLLLSEPGAPKVLVITTFENDEHVYDALRAGASGFLLKRALPEDIIRAVHVVAGGESLLFPAAIRSLAQRFAGTSDPGPVRRLTEREGTVLRLMARGMSNAEIAADLVVTIETVKTHVAGVLAKLGARDRTQAVIVAYESGYVGPGRR